jgi:hypothetical protein
LTHLEPLGFSPVSDLLAPFIEMIERECPRLGHQIGAQFLYTPARTLAPGTRLAFVPLNPGVGMYHDRPKWSYEEGSAYYSEPWGTGGVLNPLQIQVGLLYDALAEREGTTAKKLMDETLALNFCSFRSKQRWSQLDRQSKQALIAFSQEMWARILEIVEPSVIICLGNDTMKYLDPVLQARATAWTGLVERPVGWGNVKWGVRCYTARSREVMMVRIPHLSIFKIFVHPQSQQATAEIVDTISAALRKAPTAT